MNTPVIPVMTVVARKALVGPEPVSAVRSLGDGVNNIARESVFFHQVGPCAIFISCNTATPGAGPDAVFVIGKNAEYIVRIIGWFATRQYSQVMSRTGPEACVSTKGQGVGIFATETIFMAPRGPAIPIKAANTAFGAKPNNSFAIDAEAVNPFVD